jgi:hypothetical protein
VRACVRACVCGCPQGQEQIIRRKRTTDEKTRAAKGKRQLIIASHLTTDYAQRPLMTSMSITFTLKGTWHVPVVCPSRPTVQTVCSNCTKERGSDFMLF